MLEVAVHCSRLRSSSALGWYSHVMEGRKRRLIHGLVKQAKFCLNFIALWPQNGSFQRQQSSQFLGLCSNSHHGYEVWVFTKRVVFQVQMAEMEFLWSVKPLLEIDRSQLWCFGYLTKMSHKRLVSQVLLATPTGMWARSRIRNRCRDHISHLWLVVFWFGLM